MMCELLYSISCVSVSARHAEDMQSITKYCYEHHWTVLKFRSILTPLYWCYIKILFFFSSEFYVVYYYLIFGSVTSQKGLIICLFKHFKNGNHICLVCTIFFSLTSWIFNLQMKSGPHLYSALLQSTQPYHILHKTRDKYMWVNLQGSWFKQLRLRWKFLLRNNPTDRF